MNDTASEIRPTKLHHDNLRNLLVAAIEVQERDERQRGYSGDSAMLATWKEVLAGLKQGVLPVVTWN